MSADFYTPGQDLSRRGLLQILLEEAYRDGGLSDAERRTVEYFCKALKLDDQDLDEVKARAKEKYKAGELAPAAEMDPVGVYRRAVEVAFADGKASGKEKKYLKILAKVLWITPEEHARVIQELKSAGAQAEEALAAPDAEGEPVEEPPSPPPPRPVATPGAPPPSVTSAVISPPLPPGVPSERIPAAKVPPAPPVAPPAAPSPAPPLAGTHAPGSDRSSRPIAAAAPSPATPLAGTQSSGSERVSRPIAAAAPPKSAPAPSVSGRVPRPSSAMGAAPGEPALSKPVLYAGLGALGLVLLAAGLQRTLMQADPEEELPPPRPPSVETPAPSPPPPPPPAPAGPNVEAEKLVGTGMQFLQDGKLEEAIASYTRAIAIEDKQAFVHNNLGHAYERKGNDDGAIREYQRAIQLDPKYPLAYNNLGTVYERKGRTSEAMALYRRAVELKPDYANAHYNLGVLYGRGGRYDDAIVEFRKVVDARPKDPYAHKDLWLAYSRKGLDAEAKKELEIARSLGLKIGE